jgi:hypothetical protein
MRYLLLLAILVVCGCNRAAVRDHQDYDPAVDSKTELQQLEDRLGV